MIRRKSVAPRPSVKEGSLNQGCPSQPLSQPQPDLTTQHVDAPKSSESNSLQWRIFDIFKLVPDDSKKAADTNESSEESRKRGTSEKESYVKGCCCCGTVVTYPARSKKFLCTVCHTTNLLDSRNINSAETGNHAPPFISFKLVKDMLDKCLAEAQKSNANGEPKSTHQIFEPLSTYLFDSFSNFACLNGSFKIKKSSKKLHYSTSNIDIRDIHATFNLLTSLPTKRPLFKALYGASELLKRVDVGCENDPRNLKWLLILLEIPFLYKVLISGDTKTKQTCSMIDVSEIKALSYDILKRALGVLSNVNSPFTLNYITWWFAKLDRSVFSSKIDLINLYITFHLKKYFYLANSTQTGRRGSVRGRPGPSRYRGDMEYIDPSSLKDEAIESSSGPLSPGILNLPISQITNSITGLKESKKPDQYCKIKIHQYGNDWHLKTASMVLALFIKANSFRSEASKLPASIFYNSLVDFVNLKMDFDMWQSEKKFNEIKPSDNSEPEIQMIIDYIHGTKNNFKFDDVMSYFFCQFPFLVSLGGKISILEYEARRQMERKAEEAFINSLDKRIAIDVYFRVKVRREFIVQDSLRCIKLNTPNLKKSLRVQFVNELGIDAGGLKKEWFLLLTRSLFSPEAGMFVNVEDSNYLWFSISPAENNEMYFLFGAILGLAIYNSTILNLKFPTALYKLLLNIPVGLDDYRQLYPLTAKNLVTLKNYDSDVLEDLDLNFEISFKDVFGKIHSKELIPNGRHIRVTKENADQYIRCYSKFFMHDGVASQISFFIKGFSTVIGGNALSLFLPEEIELLLCGSDEETLDINTLKSITKYAGWKDQEQASNSIVIRWFWEYLEALSFKEQRKFLLFVTGSDRVPATGLQNLNFKITRLSNGRDSHRLPVAHTCFNELALYDYSSKSKFIQKLNTAVNESSGFGIK